MVAPFITASVTPILAQINQNSTEVNTPVSPTYPGVVSGTLSRTGSGAALFTNGRAAEIRGPLNTVTIFGGGFAAGLPLDMSNGYICGVMSLPSVVGLGTVAQNGVVLAARSGAGNWRRWTIGGGDEVLANFLAPTINGYWPFVVEPATPGSFLDDGTFNPANVDLVEFHIDQATVTPSVPSRLLIDECFFLGNGGLVTIEGGEVGTPASLSSIFQQFAADSAAPVQSLLFVQSGNQFYTSYLPKLTIATDYFTDLFNLEILSGFASIVIDETQRQLNINASAGDTFTAQSTSKTINDNNLSINLANAGGTLTFDGIVLVGDGVLNVPTGQTLSNTTLNSRGTLTVDGTLQAPLVSNAATTSEAIRLNTSGSILGGTVEGNSIGIAYDIGASASVGLSLSLSPTIQNNLTYDLLFENTGVASGSTIDIDISGLNKGAGSTTPNPIFINDADANNIYNITVNNTLSAADVSSAGAQLNIIAPTNPISIIGFPAGSTIVLSQSGRQLDLLNNATTPYTYVPQPGELNTYTFKVISAGNNDFITELDTNLATVAQYLGTALASQQTLDPEQTRFSELMRLDDAYLRVVGTDSSLNLPMWEVPKWQTEWNAALPAAAVTAAEIAVWIGYLATAGYGDISINPTTGEIA